MDSAIYITPPPTWACIVEIPIGGGANQDRAINHHYQERTCVTRQRRQLDDVTLVAQVRKTTSTFSPKGSFPKKSGRLDGY